jgi:hypothetical protein
LPRHPAVAYLRFVRPMTLHGPFSCPRVVLLLFAASLVCVVVWYLALAGWAFASGNRVIENTAFEIISYIAILGLSAVAYTVILGRSMWFISLRPSIRWSASVISAIILMFVFAVIFQIALAMYAGW